jgi:hypothetical protein
MTCFGKKILAHTHTHNQSGGRERERERERKRKKTLGRHKKIVIYKPQRIKTILLSL